MEGKLKIKIGGEEIEATFDEWEGLNIELNKLFKSARDIVCVPINTPFEPLRYDPYRITYTGSTAPERPNIDWAYM